MTTLHRAAMGLALTALLGCAKSPTLEAHKETEE
jgi:hypothetical protein